MIGALVTMTIILAVLYWISTAFHKVDEVVGTPQLQETEEWELPQELREAQQRRANPSHPEPRPNLSSRPLPEVQLLPVTRLSHGTQKYPASRLVRVRRYDRQGREVPPDPEAQ